MGDLNFTGVRKGPILSSADPLKDSSTVPCAHDAVAVGDLVIGTKLTGNEVDDKSHVIGGQLLRERYILLMMLLEQMRHGLSLEGIELVQGFNHALQQRVPQGDTEVDVDAWSFKGE